MKPKDGAITAVAAASLFGMVTAFGTVNQSPIPVDAVTVTETIPIEQFDVAVPAAEPEGYWHEETVRRGDTFAAILDRLGVNNDEISKLLRENGRAKPFRVLRPGIVMQALTTPEGELIELRFLQSRETVLGFARDGDQFTAIEENPDLNRQVFVKSGEIRSSLFATTDEIDVPDGVAVQMAEIFGGDIDFNRDLRKGDRFTVMYETFYHQGQAVGSGRVLAAEFVNAGKALRAVWFEDESGQGSYYAPDGKSLRKAFLRSPLEFSRVTSGFKMRFHPILKTWRAHNGIDYAAPTGTRVRATANGVVEFAGRQNGYGNVVILRHGNGITTAYAHLNGFASGLSKGSRVTQGDTIGYVGATGLATGPHLHYEFRVNNEHRNPLTIAFPSADPVPAHRMDAFRAATASLAARLEDQRELTIAAVFE